MRRAGSGIRYATFRWARFIRCWGWRSGCPRGERALHLGAAASREIALERCLTELYQGNAGAVSRRFHRPGALNERDETAAAWAYMAMVTDGSGAFPDRVFDGPPSYPPHDAGAPFATDAQALCTYVDLARERGSAVYVRDYSRLGFPVYRVYVPGASETFLHFPLSRAEVRGMGETLAGVEDRLQPARRHAGIA